MAEPLYVERTMSQRKLADATGISQRTIVVLETDRREPHPSTLEKLASALGIEPSELLQRFAVRLNHHTLWGIDASLEELRKKIRDAAKCAVP